jgi:hypothetical protein
MPVGAIAARAAGDTSVAPELMRCPQFKDGGEYHAENGDAHIFKRLKNVCVPIFHALTPPGGDG